jgi:tRNA nucleotidyltransferase/poly(A) polymerase
MKTFHQWIKESSLGDELNFPQDPRHHPEGGVRRHTMMVRHSLDQAINLLQRQQKSNSDGPLSNLDLSINQNEYNILRLAGLLHDIGKGESFEKSTRDDGSDKITHIGHDQPKFFEPAMQRLGPMWQKMYQGASPVDREDLWYLIKNHMALDDETGIESKSLKRDMLDDQGKYKPERRVKLLLVLFLMDRLGRGGTPGNWQTAKQYSQGNTEAGELGLRGMDTTSLNHKQNLDRIASRASKLMASDPSGFVAGMREKGKPAEVIKSALRGRFSNLTDQDINQLIGESKLSFKVFFESEENKIRARLPLSDDVFTLSKVFKDNSHQIYVVGGAPRDFLRHYFKNPDEPFDTNKTKDVDLTTGATPKQVKEMLTKAGIKNFGKGESFGVMVAHINGEDYEIATFREDLGYSDGRRPDQVRWTDMATDHKRRDLTMNAIYYEIPASPDEDGTFIDPSGGKGFEDIKNWTVRMIGDPFERIGEDKLRIARIPRFHSYYNNDDIRSVLDQDTLGAIDQYKDMRNHGVTGPRIQQEFFSGLKKSSDTVSYLRNYERLGLLSTVFPNLELDIEAVDRLGHEDIHATKNNGFNHAILVLALLLRKNGSPDKVRSALNKLEWPNEVSDGVAFLLKTWQSAQSPTSDSMIRAAQEMSKKPNRRDIVLRSRHIAGDDVSQDHLSHLGEYEPPMFSGEEIQRQLGLSKPGPEIGQEMKRRSGLDYENSFFKWKNRPPIV